MAALGRMVLPPLFAVWFMTAIALAMATALSVRERRREIGIYRALGATRAGLLRLILSETLRIAGGGVVTGLQLGTALYLALENSPGGLTGVFFVRPGASFFLGLGVLVAAAALVTALLAALLPARSASRLEPYRCIRAPESPDH